MSLCMLVSAPGKTALKNTGFLNFDIGNMQINAFEILV